jgi:hypothetical protein
LADNSSACHVYPLSVFDGELKLLAPDEPGAR